MSTYKKGTKEVLKNENLNSKYVSIEVPFLSKEYFVSARHEINCCFMSNKSVIMLIEDSEEELK